MTRNARSRWITVAVTAALLIPLGWAGMESYKRRRDFCVSCHLSSGKRLHSEKMEGMTARPPRTLAGVHNSLFPEPMTCPHCHRGVDFPGKLKVACLELRHTAAWLAGAFREPRSMESHIGNEHCDRCHHDIDPKPFQEARTYHDFASHDKIKKVTCPQCHTAHTGRNSSGGFWDRERVLEKCGACHKNPETSPGILKSLESRRASGDATIQPAFR